MQNMLTIDVVPGRDHVTLRLTGELDTYTAQSVRNAALDAMREHAANIRIDLSGVTFLDATGLEVLLATRRRAQLEGGQLELLDPTRTVVRVLEVSGVSGLFGRAPSTTGEHHDHKGARRLPA
jgi:anti-sigma B factor antagonist